MRAAALSRRQMQWEPLGGSGTASDGERGHWLLPDDVVLVLDPSLVLQGGEAARWPATRLPPLLPFPRDWPAVFKSSAVLKKLVNKRLKGVRCRAVAPLDGNEAAQAGRLCLHRLHSHRNAARVKERLGWPVVHGWRIFEAADREPGEAFVAARHWWNMTPSGAWADLTPPALAHAPVGESIDVDAGGAHVVVAGRHHVRHRAALSSNARVLGWLWCCSGWVGLCECVCVCVCVCRCGCLAQIVRVFETMDALVCERGL